MKTFKGEIGYVVVAVVRLVAVVGRINEAPVTFAGDSRHTLKALQDYLKEFGCKLPSSFAQECKAKKAQKTELALRSIPQDPQVSARKRAQNPSLCCWF